MFARGRQRDTASEQTRKCAVTANGFSLQTGRFSPTRSNLCTPRPSISITTPQQRSHPRDCAPSPWSPPDASSAPFPRRSPRRSSTNAARGGLEPPPAGRLRRANLHLSHSTTPRNLAYINQLLSAFVAQVGFENSGGLGFRDSVGVRGFSRPSPVCRSFRVVSACCVRTSGNARPQCAPSLTRGA